VLDRGIEANQKQTLEVDVDHRIELATTQINHLENQIEHLARQIESVADQSNLHKLAEELHGQGPAKVLCCRQLEGACWSRRRPHDLDVGKQSP